MGKESVSGDAHSRRDWVIFVIEFVQDRPSQVRFQRLVALTDEFNVIVVTSKKLPGLLDRLVNSVIIADSRTDVWSITNKTSKYLQDEGKKFYIHTQYSPIQSIAGFLCKRQFGCKWVYDLWDHPSLTYSSRKGPARWVRQFIDMAVRRWMLDKADAWIIAMHPAILGYMPPAPTSCRIIFTQPGFITEKQEHVVGGKRGLERGELIRIAYAGPITRRRLDSLVSWVGGYSGPAVDLQIIGILHEKGPDGVLAAIEQACLNNSNISFKYHGELPHPKTVEILRTSDIGICPLDTTVLNYKFAFAIKIIEQMQLGLIVVANEAHGVRAYVKDGENGILAANETNGMRKALNRAINICANPSKKDKMSKAAIESVKDDTWPIKNKQLLGMIKAALK